MSGDDLHKQLVEVERDRAALREFVDDLVSINRALSLKIDQALLALGRSESAAARISVAAEILSGGRL